MSSAGGERLITPFDGPIDATSAVPGSKSVTNRALIAAALGAGRSVLTGALVSDDTEAMVGCLRSAGVVVAPGPGANSLVVDGVAGAVRVAEATLDVRQSGTTARFVTPMLALGHGRFHVDGHPQMRARPMGDLLRALTALGADIVAVDGNDRLPLVLRSSGLAGGTIVVAGSSSSQFLSGMLLSAPCFRSATTVHVDGELVSKPYVDMTLAVMATFGAAVERIGYERFVVQPTGYRGVKYAIEPDASAASYLFAAAAITGGRVRVTGFPAAPLQGDLRFLDVLAEMGCRVGRDADAIEVVGPDRLRGVSVDMADCSDVAQTLAAVAVFADSPTRVTGIGFIRKKETDRIAAVVRELRRCGIASREEADGFVVHPGTPSPATIETYDDHRMAMSFALLGLRVEGIRIVGPGCVAKTFPNFFDVIEALRP